MTAAQGSVRGFTPSANAFRFTNSFPKAPTVRVDLWPVGRVGLGNASQGVCGGMVFAVRDYFEAQQPVPDDAAAPQVGTTLFNYITARLTDSFNGVAGVTRYLTWMMLPSGNVHTIFGSRVGTFARTVASSWPQVRADIDAGHPSPLGVVTVHTADVRQIGRCHQVLAYGYAIDDAGTVTLNVYDPNTNHASADDVWISFAVDRADQASTISHNINIGAPALHGFFRSGYSAKQPPTGIG